jgi:hypothetical protein
MAVNTNVNLDTVANGGNTGKIKNFAAIGIPRAIVLVPSNFAGVPAVSMISNTAFNTFTEAKFKHNTRSERWFAFTNLDKFENLTKKASTEDTGRLQLDVYNFPQKFQFRYMQNMGNYIEMTAFQNCQGLYNFYIIDDNGNWWGTKDTTGSGRLLPYTLQQFYVPNWEPHTVTTDTAFMLTVSMADPKQMCSNFKVYEANTSPDAIVMLENIFLNDVSSVLGTPLSITTTTDIVFTAKYGQEARDWVQDYMAAITAGCFVATNLTTGATLTISSITTGTIVSAGQVYYYVWAILSAAPTVGHVVQIATATPSAVNAIIPNNNVVTEITQPGVNQYSAAVHTF